MHLFFRFQFARRSNIFATALPLPVLNSDPISLDHVQFHVDQLIRLIIILGRASYDILEIWCILNQIDRLEIFIILQMMWYLFDSIYRLCNEELNVNNC